MTDYVMGQSGRQSSYDIDDEDTATIETTREPFWDFIPKLSAWAGGIVGGELAAAGKAVVDFPTWSAECLLETVVFYRENPRTLFEEVLSAFTVAIMQVPESIAFSFVAGVPPLSGLHATFWMATVTGLLGGKPGMISGAAGALAVVVTDLTIDDGVLDYLTEEERLNVLYMTMFVCGIAQILFAWFRLANLVKLIPQTGLIGFMDGLCKFLRPPQASHPSPDFFLTFFNPSLTCYAAIIIFMAQLPAFQKCDFAERFVGCTVDERQWLTFTDDTGVLLLTLLHVAICMAIMKVYPSVPRIGKLVPASLVSLLMGTFLEHAIFRRFFDIATRTVEETAPMSGSLPKWDWPSVPRDSETMGVILSYAITLAAIGGVESILTLQACNELTDTVPLPRDSNQELFAQGLGNLVCGLFRAMGGDAMIGQSTINIMNGARYRVSSTMSGVFMLLFVIALGPFIELLPIATLTGVLFMVVLSTFQWKTFVILRYGRLSDSIAILAVTLIAVFFNLAVAIAVGIVFSALVHAWDSGSHVDADIETKSMIINGEEKQVKYVKVKGAVFFSSVRKFVNMFHILEDPPTIIIDFEYALIVDHSAVAAIQGITQRFAKVEKQVLLINLCKKSHGRLHRTGDHKVLRRQITPAVHVRDSSDAEVGKVSTVSDTGGTETPPLFDHHTEAHRVENLPMFQATVDTVEHEVDILSQKQGDFSIHDKKEK